MKSEQQVVYDNLFSVCRRVKNAFQRFENPYLADVKVQMTIVECNRMEDALRYIKNQPEIVQCKDCEYADMHSDYVNCKNNVGNCGVIDCNTSHPLDWFCADGRRKNHEY